MSTIEKAIAIAAQAHAGQIDKGGAPYIFHPLRLMLAVSTPHEQMTAVLRNVLEDTAIAIDDLQTQGFPPEVLVAIEALTKKPGESRIDSAHRAAQNPVTRAVKLANVTDKRSRPTALQHRDFRLIQPLI
jgi:GTP diphosphokinase / guanosine-3',5'-bis(diphosphate) 3'-diphosphatase